MVPKLKIVVLQPPKQGFLGSGPEASVYDVAEVPDTLDALQGVVGGYIEELPRSHELSRQLPAGVVAVCNEEGAMRQLPRNCWGLRGTVFFVRSKGESYASLTPRDIQAIARMF